MIDLGGLPVSPCFSSFLLETRASDSFDAMLKDFVGGHFGMIPDPPVVEGDGVCGAGTVTLHASCEGNSTAYWYSSENGTTPVFIGSEFTVEITDTTTYWVECRLNQSECTSDTRVPVIATSYESPIAGADFEPIACYGGSTDVTISATGGAAPYTGTGTSSYTAGSYSVTVSDANGCQTVVEFTIDEPEQLIAQVEFDPIACYGDSTDVTISATGGTAPYTGTGTFSYGAGSYSVTVTDANGCQTMVEFTIDEPEQLIAEADFEPMECDEVTTMVTITASGGTAPYTGTGTFPFGAGNHTVTVTDANGCSTVVEFTIDEPEDCWCPNITITQGGWGAPANGNNWGVFRDAHFATAFPDGLYIGDGDRWIHLTNAAAIRAFLPSGTKPRVLDSGTKVDPGNSYRNVFAGQVTALALNIRFSEIGAGIFGDFGNLGDMIMAHGDFEGWTVYEVFDMAMQVLGGTSTAYSPAQMNGIIDNINNNFHEGTGDNGWIGCAEGPTDYTWRVPDDNKPTNPHVFTSITLYPNPTSGEINVDFTTSSDKAVSAKLYNMQGIMVADLSEYVSKTGDQVQIRYTGTNLEKGIHLLKVQTGSYTRLLKVIVK